MYRPCLRCEGKKYDESWCPSICAYGEARKRLKELEGNAKTGKWLLEQQPDGTPYCFHCSVCDLDFSRIDVKIASNFCPNCGAKMDLEQKVQEENRLIRKEAVR